MKDIEGPKVDELSNKRMKDHQPVHREIQYWDGVRERDGGKWVMSFRKEMQANMCNKEGQMAGIRWIYR